jgi:hypothetical protein
MAKSTRGEARYANSGNFNRGAVNTPVNTSLKEDIDWSNEMSQVIKINGKLADVTDSAFDSLLTARIYDSVNHLFQNMEETKPTNKEPEIENSTIMHIDDLILGNPMQYLNYLSSKQQQAKPPEQKKEQIPPAISNLSIDEFIAALTSNTN